VGAVATVAGIQGAKITPLLIPMCHPLLLSRVRVDTQVVPLEEPGLLDAFDDQCVRIECAARVVGTTGVEMEALTGASVAALTVVDMCKSATKGKPRSIEIHSVRLLSKTGGRSGNWLSQA
jgi:cyclic pyranopterin monophosphate synthase